MQRAATALIPAARRQLRRLQAEPGERLVEIEGTQRQVLGIVRQALEQFGVQGDAQRPILFDQPQQHHQRAEQRAQRLRRSAEQRRQADRQTEQTECAGQPVQRLAAA
ncbi:hypothetical protein D3C86_1733630 [compost metagenome]